jgi:hypothetical protein
VHEYHSYAKGIVHHSWRFGEIRVLELSDDNLWKREEVQEFEFRVTGYAGESMKEPGWFARQRGYLYDWTWGVTTNALPFAVLFSTETSQYRRCSSTASGCPRSVSIENANWTETLVFELIQLAVNTLRNRAATVAEQGGHLRGYDDGLARCPLPTEKPKVQSVSCKAYQMLEKLTDEILLCPITTTLLENPVVSHSGHTFSESAIQRWLQEHNTNPLTNEPMFATELVPNYIVERARSGLIEECNREELLTIEPLQGLSLLRWGPRIGKGEWQF